MSDISNIGAAVIGSGFIGTFGIASCVVGYLKATMPVWQRAVMAASGIALLHQGWTTDAAGLVLMAAMVIMARRGDAARQAHSN